MAKRRANGEGNIRKRKDGRWEGRYTAGHDPETGKAIYRNVLGKTQAEVKEKLKAAIQEAKKVDVVKAGQYTVGQWVEVWLENYAKVHLRPSTYQTDLGFLENHIKPNIGKSRWQSWPHWTSKSSTKSCSPVGESSDWRASTSRKV